MARGLLTLIAREVLLIAGCLVAWALLPAVLGMTMTTVMSDSMAPGVRAGDVVAARPVDAEMMRRGEVLQGSVLLVEDPDRPGRLRLHRWVGVRNDRLVLRGDANALADSSSVSPSAVRAVGFLRVPLAGLPVLWTRTGQVLPLLGFAAASALVIAAAFPTGRRRHPGPPRGRAGGRGASSVRRLAPAAVLPLLAALMVVQPGAWASFFKTTSTQSRSSLASQVIFDCFVKSYPNVPQASLRYGYAAALTPVEADQSGAGRDGRVTSVSLMRNGSNCSGNPYISTSTSSTYAFEGAAVTSPAQFGVSVWFRTTTAGGKLAGFGDTASGNSTTYDRHVYMSNGGLLTFGVQTSAGPVTCTSSGSFADGAWHLVVATYSSGALTMWTDDGQPGCTATTTGTIIGYQGYWQFGNDTLNRATWANASTKSYFIGDLDETAVYDSPLTAADDRAIFAAGR